MTKTELKLKLKPWLTKGIMTLIKKKNKAYKRFNRATNSAEKNILYNDFKNQKSSHEIKWNQ